jgi:hypothetical protein
MARVKIFVSQHEMIRLVSPAMILGRYAPLQKRTKATTETAVVDSTAIQSEEAAAPIMRPTQVGQIVDIYRRGAARVTSVHGGPPPTHVDVRFLLGNARDECKIPIETVRLAPELDPDSGRCLRQVSKPGAKKPSGHSSVSSSDGTPQSDRISSPTSSDTSVIEISD